MRRRHTSEREQLDLFRALPGDLAPRDARRHGGTDDFVPRGTCSAFFARPLSSEKEEWHE